MYRLGHTGIALLVLAPLSYVLLEAQKPILALVTGVAVVSIEPLPDSDFRVAFLDHRGVSHSLLAAVVVGGVIGLCGWFLTEPVCEFFAPVLTALSTVTTTAASALESLELTGALGTATVVVADVLRASAAGLGWVGERLETLTRRTVAIYGFAVGVVGILIHLLGDVITVSGIKPFLPFSRWQLSVSSLHANSTLANFGLSAVGALAIAVVLATTVGGVGFAALPADLSPVGIAAGQQTQTHSQNATNTTASVVFTNQTTNGTTVTIKRVTLPENGFVAIHTGGYATGPAPAEYSIIAVSDHLTAGTHQNVTIDISHAPPSNAPGLNRSQLNNSQTLAAVAYRDTNDNHRFDFVRSFGKQDQSLMNNGSIVADQARVRIPTPPPQTASVELRNQTLQDNTITIASARLPKGGFIVIHNESYLPPQNKSLESAVGVTKYLPPGQYDTVTVPLINGSVTTNQTLVAVPYYDTNGNKQYDYVESSGFRDIAYVNRTGNQSRVVTDPALVRVSASTQQTSSQTQTPTPTQTPTSSPSEGTVGGSGGFFGFGIVGIIALCAVVASAFVVIWRRR
jgi:membrane-bound metal-dependent hydrolase YbcI (DUF457 family)